VCVRACVCDQKLILLQYSQINCLTSIQCLQILYLVITCSCANRKGIKLIWCFPRQLCMPYTSDLIAARIFNYYLLYWNTLKNINYKFKRPKTSKFADLSASKFLYILFFSQILNYAPLLSVITQFKTEIITII